MSHSVVSARDASTAVDSMVVICTGSGPLVVYMDADGRPTTAPHMCPDCALHLLAGILRPASEPEAVTCQAYRSQFVSDDIVIFNIGSSCRARGPPDLI